MDKRHIEKPRVEAVGAVRLPEGVRVVSTSSEALHVGEWHVRFELAWAPEATVDVCLDRGSMVGLVITGHLSARGLQRIPLRTLERAALWKVRTSGDMMLRTLDGKGAPASRLFGEELHREMVERGTGPAGGVPSERLVKLARFAKRYEEQHRMSATPTKDLAEQDCIATATASDRLHEARRAKLLTSEGAGRAGGELTPKAKALLSTTGED